MSSSFEVVKANGLYPGETSWEVMEQSQLYGEKPVRLVFSADCIRTVTSLALTKPKEFKEFWRVNSSQILKVSWCPDLCVLYVLSVPAHDKTQQVTKVFFAEHIVGKRMMQHYKKVKPATVALSPARRTKVKHSGSKKFLTINNEDDRSALLSTSFRLRTSLNQEKFWRALVLYDYTVCRELFFGISPSGVRLVIPDTLEPELVISLICVSDIKFYTYLGSPTLALKYYQDTISTTKTKKIRFHVLPVTGQEMLRWYDYCVNLGDIENDAPNFPCLKPSANEILETDQDQSISLKNSDTEERGMLRISSADSVQQPLKPANKKKESAKPLSKNNNYPNPTNDLHTQKYKSTGTSKPQLTKSRSFINSGRF